MKSRNKLVIQGSPHLRDGWTGQKIMITVFIALLPASFAGVYFFGYNALFIIIASLLSAWITDILLQYIIIKHSTEESKNKKIVYLNWSSLLTGLLMGLVLPPGIKLWLPVLGSIFAVSLGKYAFGKGNNIFNPALIARTFLVLSFPAFMGSYIIPDSITSATPLTVMKNQGLNTLAENFGGVHSLYNNMIIGSIGGCIGETSVIALILGAIILFYFKIISWRIPFTYLGTVAVISILFGRDPIFNLVSGGLFLGAFFMATDYVTSPITKKGKIIFGAGLGILTMLIRIYSSYPEGVAFSILLMNAAVPLIERYTKPIPLGGKK